MDPKVEREIGDVIFEIYESVKNNEKTLDQLKWFNSMTRKGLNVLLHNPAKYFVEELEKVMNKFELYIDLGEIVISSDYEKNEYYDSIPEEHLKNLYFEGKVITKKSAPFPSSNIKRGSVLRVRLFRQKSEEDTTSDERMLFLVANNAIFLGMQGIVFLAEYKRSDLEIDLEYSSFEKPANSLRNKENKRLVPTLSLDSVDDGNDTFDTVNFLPFVETTWDESNILICFTQEFE